MNPSCNPFSPNGQYQQGCGPNQPQSVNLMDQLMGMSESLRQERQRQELMSNMMPVLMGQGAAAPFQQGGGGTYGYGRNPKDRPPLQCYHRCKDGNRCNGPHLAKDCPRAAAEREEDIRAEVERRTKIKEEAVHTTTLKMEPPPPPATLMPYGSAMMMPPPPMPTQHLQQLQMQQVQQQQQLGAQMSAPELAMCTPAPRQMVDQTGAVENMKEMFKESLEELKEDLNSTWEPHFNEVKALSHENAAKGVLIRSELNSLMAKVSESNKQIEILKAGLEGLLYYGPVPLISQAPVSASLAADLRPFSRSATGSTRSMPITPELRVHGSPPRRFCWPWLRGAGGKRRVKLGLSDSEATLRPGKQDN